MGVEVVAALIYSGALITKGVMDRQSAGKAADLQIQGTTSAARIRAGSMQDQIDMANQAARQLRADTEHTREANYGQYVANLQNTSNLTFDQAENLRRSGNVIGENVYNRYWDTEKNRRQELLAKGRTGYGQDVARNMRLGRMGARMGMQAPGGRRMGQLFEPGSLVQTPYERVGPLQRTDLVIPEYVRLPDRIPADVQAQRIIAATEREYEDGEGDPYDDYYYGGNA